MPGEYSGAPPVTSVYRVWAGCCAMRPLDFSVHRNAFEIKHLYVRPQFRGLGLCQRLAEAIRDAGPLSAYDCILLGTLDDMDSARALYKELGVDGIAS